jgi:hypothetical protein
MKSLGKNLELITSALFLRHFVDLEQERWFADRFET